jgi:hypothetical protein
MPDWRFRRFAAGESASHSGDGVDLGKELISYQQSTAADPLTSTYRSSFRLRTADATTELCFVFEII